LQAEVCKFLIQNSRTVDLPVLALALRVVFNLFNAMKQHLKVQLEVFFTSGALY
jgi:brefeldin A-resistance guanine nucleotide exchange factor 1